ncbi:hypothetical protein BGW36DRAFT_390346 [Talaromyces proteolyticus]|uniref:Barwin domain-containing protein n=1 Tax=Talaromyces proteolyticus TaxID=1131652 RepID=A0AAD4KFW5_9EURO|nr:uncharacterized protein BGW36DRAFT_390346 [Talaromyces proteolyticus]KAH8690188.1 hypothetical protein BGW36DRAFT_390346 [Talaromyces proteolyticus]
MKFTSTLTASALVLASQTMAMPVEKRDIPSSYYNDMPITGSIFAFGDDASCNQVFYNSGSCGFSTYFPSLNPSSTGAELIALSASVMDQFGAAQNDELCGKTIEITGPNGVTKQAVIADRAGADIIDMCSGLWTAFGSQDGDGTNIQIQWKVVQ